ncbi:protein-export chaperone SecB [Qipengyuania psychrotolerans]|uniref:Protein-export protein SecB n=1 Tax=Qipengyuania psychrotolerans TaxID=2867238 RepID=A0ABX8ZE61_9SPHN|nr:protein-export chaperone SecB [Qipengyuania psychrotolerans]QZD87295.1 protein-export chaperone SecB [Qipengyuania psychrotolerans]
MADENDVLTDLNADPAAGSNGADNRPTFGVLNQYVKDLSVENPNAPTSYQWQEQPRVDIQVNIASKAITDEVHEVELKMTARADAEQGAMYIVELAYCGLVGIRNVPDEHAHAFLFAETPRLLFPYARSIISSAVTEAGFPPLMLEPMDFGALYQQQLEARAAQQNEGAPAPTGNA